MTTDEVREVARQQGADLFGVGPAETYVEYRDEVQRRLAETGATSGDFMIRADDAGYFERIADARHTLPSARAVILLGVYAFDTFAAGAEADDPSRGKIARTYVYYSAARRVGDTVAGFLQQHGYAAVAGQDVPLKHLAVRLGLACYGSNGILLTPKFGSYVALRSVITEAPLAATSGVCPDLCTNCGLCLPACPTGAIYEPGKVNPQLCLNPITRRADPIAPELRPKLQNWVRGCDICQEICPVNQTLTPRSPDPRAQFEPAHHDTHRGLAGCERFPELISLLGPDRPDNLRRQAAIALANSGTRDRTAIVALRDQRYSGSAELQSYFEWAIEVLDAVAIRDGAKPVVAVPESRGSNS